MNTTDQNINSIADESLPAAMTPTGVVSENVRMWGMILHFSQLLGFLIPILGFATPIIIWQVKKDQMPELDRHGREVTNWMISALIYTCVCFLMMLLLIGFPMLYALGVLVAVFPVIGGIKANQGEFWKYPLTIRFFKVALPAAK